MSKGWKVTLRAALAGAAILALASCQSVSTTSAGAVGVERKQSMSSLVSEQQVEQQAKAEYAQVLADARKKGVLNQNPAQVQRVQAVAKRLTPQTAAFRPDAARWAWEVAVISDPQVNAWCMPGGKIAVYTGLVDKLALTDDELAAVMGHEIAHALREHSREKISKQAPVALLGELAAAAGYGAWAQLGTQGYLLMVGLPNSREMETEADRIGVELAARAGYDPRAAVSLWRKMDRAGGGGTPEFLSTHPSNASRLGDLQIYAERVMPLYQAARP